MTPERFNETQMSVTLLSAVVADMPLEAFLDQLAIGGPMVPANAATVLQLEAMASALLRVKETAQTVRSYDERRKDLESLRAAPSVIEDALRAVEAVQPGMAK